VTKGTKDKMINPDSVDYYLAEIPRSVSVNVPYSHFDMLLKMDECFLQTMGKLEK